MLAHGDGTQDNVILCDKNSNVLQLMLQIFCYKVYPETPGQAVQNLV